MAVHKRNYRAYQGDLTAEWSRFLILPRYAWRELFKQRFLLIFYVACFFYPVGCAIAMYLNANLQFLAQFIQVPQNGLFEFGNRFFLIFCNFQNGLAFVLTAFIGPGLISPDLANHALPLYFCRPFSRVEYVAGKLSVIVLLLSTITWIPALILYFLQWNLGGQVWFEKNSFLIAPIVLTTLLWIFLISLLALALSAWVRWKVVAGAAMLVVFFLGAGLGQAINAVMLTNVGSYVDIGTNMGRVVVEYFRIRESPKISVEEAIASLMAVCGICLYLLWKKIRAYEVVR